MKDLILVNLKDSSPMAYNKETVALPLAGWK